MAVVASGIFAGAALYISVVEHPARMSAGATIALQEFRPSYKRAAPIQVSLALICFLASISLWVSTHEVAWLAGGALVAAVIPYTLIFMMRGNRRLLDVNSPPVGGDAQSLLVPWGRLHAVRTVLGLAGFLVLVFQSIRG